MGTIYKLIIEDDEGKTTVYPLSQGEISIGRKEGNTIRLMERNVSRRHARLLRANGSVFIEDLDSYNGIRINGERINGRYEVKEGDLVEIGDYHLALQAAEVEEEAPRESPRPDPNANREGEWPTAGTVPDFRLPEEILAGVRAAGGTPQGPRPITAAPRDTLVDQPAPAQAPMPAVMTAQAKGSGPANYAGNLAEASPLVNPPPSPHDLEKRPLPSFPQPGTPPAPALFPRPGGVTELDSRPPALKPAQVAKKDEPLAPTAPINVGPARTSSVPRLVCVSTNYAGKEFALTRPELIIGRVEDNDIVIEHRSVSRNHAKIVFDGRAHKIIDLQSANGILVNGEEYAMTDLRKNDLIELGHVRFRFIPAGEPFLPSDDEIREMRDAGVTAPANDTAAMLARSIEATQPHLGSDRPAPAPAPPSSPPKLVAPQNKPHEEVPAHFDPSTAATVTDTPLSALAMNQILTPQIEPSPAATLPAGPPPPRKEHDKPREILEKNDRHEKSEKNDRSNRSDRSDTAAPRSTAASPQSHDQRPTEINIAARSAPTAPANGSAAGASPPPRQHIEPPPATRPNAQNLVEVEGRLEPPKAATKTIAIIAVALIIVAGVAVAFVMSGQSDAADLKLAEMMTARDYPSASAFCGKNLGRGVFKNETAAKVMCDMAASQPKPEQPRQDPPPNPNNNVQEPEGQNERENGEPPAGDPPDEGAETAVADPEGDRNKTKQVRRNPPAKAQPVAKAPPAAGGADKIPRAKELHDKAWRAWTNGDATKAVELLNECVRVANLGKCHRTLGSVYAQIGDTQKSLQHYKKYLEIEPNAPDVNRVRDIIRDAEP